MKSKVSFVCKESEIEPIKLVLKNFNLTDLRILPERIGDEHFRIFVYAEEDINTIYKLCVGLFARVYVDTNKEI